MSVFDGYGFGQDWELFDYSSLLEDKLAEQIGMKPKRGRMMVNAPPDEDLERYLPTKFDTQGTADAIKAIDAMMGAGSTAPTGINPAAPAESQPPAVAVPASSAGPEPNKYERMRGVSNSDRLGAIGMAMSSIGTPQFANVYRGAQLGLIDKQKTADEYNMMLEMGTKPQTKMSGNTMITTAAKFIQNSDGSYSLNPNAGEVLDSKSYGTRGSTSQAYNTFITMKQNGDISPETTWDEFKASSNFDIFRTDYMNKVKNTTDYLKSIGIDDPDLASQMAAGALTFEDMEGGGIKVFDLAGNVVQEIESPEQAREFEQAFQQASSYGSKSGEAAVTDLQGFEQDFEEIADGFSETQSSIARGREAMRMLESQEVDSGFVQGAIAKTFGIGDRQMGKLQGLSGQELIKALSQTTLVPVSDTDIKKLELMFANISQDPEFAMGILESFLAERERSLVLSRDKFRRRIDRLNENPNIRSPQRESDSFIKTYGNIYNFKIAAELLEEEGI
jgi:hypothetical protein